MGTQVSTSGFFCARTLRSQLCSVAAEVIQSCLRGLRRSFGVADLLSELLLLLASMLHLGASALRVVPDSLKFRLQVPLAPIQLFDSQRGDAQSAVRRSGVADSALMRPVRIAHGSFRISTIAARLDLVDRSGGGLGQDGRTSADEGVRELGESGRGFQFADESAGGDGSRGRRVEERSGDRLLDSLPSGSRDPLASCFGELGGSSREPARQRTTVTAELGERPSIQILLRLSQLLCEVQCLGQLGGALVCEHIDHPCRDRGLLQGADSSCQGRIRGLGGMGVTCGHESSRRPDIELDSDVCERGLHARDDTPRETRAQ